MSSVPREQLWSEVGVQAVINAPGLPREQRDYVSRLHSAFRRAPEVDDDTLKLPVLYHRARHGYGRRFEGPRGLQSASRQVRRLCSAKYYRDWDIENAFPVILHAKMMLRGSCARCSVFTCATARHACLQRCPRLGSIAMS
jgi:hypothetical protein